MKYESNISQIFTGYFAALIKESWLFFLMGFKKDTENTKKWIGKSLEYNEWLFSTEKQITMKEYKNIQTFDQLIEVEHGKIGTESRNTYEEKSQMFIISEMLKEARREAKITQEELAAKTGTKKSYISRIENGKGNIQLSTVIRIFQIGLNKRIGFTFL